MEQRGAATVSFCTDQFAPLASTEAKGMGLHGLPLIVVPHPNATRSPDELDRIAAQVVDQVAEGLTKPAKLLEEEYRGKKYTLPKKSVGEVK